MKSVLNSKQDNIKWDPILKEIVAKFVPAFNPSAIYLFGSQATGNTHPDSDYDVLVVVPELSEPSRSLSVKARELLGDVDAAFDIFFLSEEKFNRQKDVVNTLADIVLFEGVKLYAA